MNLKKNVALAPYTSFRLGGPAECFVEVSSTDELLEVVRNNKHQRIWLLGYGSNTLISDKGLEGLVICMRGGSTQIAGQNIIVDAGVWWDDVVKLSIDHGLWGIELMSEIPGSVGAAVYINITAYGQSIGKVVEWVEVWDPKRASSRRINKDELKWDYKQSIFQNPANKGLIILRTCLGLSTEHTDKLVYQKALDVAGELKLDPNDLEQRRKIIIEARHRAGSIWKPDDKKTVKTVGSFFRNPVVSPKQAAYVMAFEEHGNPTKQIKKQNLVHGGNTRRVSAAHVMLAAGFKRGQSWGKVKLNEQNLLKIEALPGATAQEVYDVAMEIQQTVQDKLDIKLEPEARILGEF